MKDGGPAYPVIYPHENSSADGIGMSLRDAAALAALQGLCECKTYDGGTWQRIAKDSFDAADAFIAERERREKDGA